MQPKQYDSRTVPVDRHYNEPVSAPDGITMVLEKECTETMYAVEETEKLLVDIVMRYTGKPPQGRPEGGVMSGPPSGVLNTTIQGLRDMRAKLSVMREDVSVLL